MCECTLCNYFDKIEPKARLYPLHLGRAEDWFVPNDNRIISLIPQPWKGNTGLYHWIPKTNDTPVLGLFYKVPTFYYLHNRVRVFHFKDCYLNDGLIPTACNEYIDTELEEIENYLPENFYYENGLPVFFIKP